MVKSNAHGNPLHHRHRPLPFPQRFTYRGNGQIHGSRHRHVGLVSTIPIINILDRKTIRQTMLVGLPCHWFSGAMLRPTFISPFQTFVSSVAALFQRRFRGNYSSSQRLGWRTVQFHLFPCRQHFCHSHFPNTHIEQIPSLANHLVVSVGFHIQLQPYLHRLPLPWRHHLWCHLGCVGGINLLETFPGFSEKILEIRTMSQMRQSVCRRQR